MSLGSRGARRGANLLEVTVATVLAGVVLSGMGAFMAGAFKTNRQESDRGFAQRKATQMLNELSGLHRQQPDLGSLAAQVGGPSFNLSLEEVDSPTEAVSGNKNLDGVYRYLRQVELTPVAGDPGAVQATVKVWVNQARYTSPGVPPQDPVGVASQIFRSKAPSSQDRQVLRVYAISIANLPHLVLSKLGTAPDFGQLHPSQAQARADFEGALAKLQADNPWLDVQLFYISRLGLGRDARYRPYANQDKPAEGSGADSLPHVYAQPASILGGATNYLEPAAWARLLRGTSTGAVRDGDRLVGAATNLPVADRFNHAVRGVEELAVGSGGPAQAAPLLPPGFTEPSLSQLLAGMAQGLPRYRNALVVNLHGELFPALPLRPYGDAARDEEDGIDPDDKAHARHWARRLVTHPQRLVADASQPVRLYVHPFMEDGNDTDEGEPGSKKATSLRGSAWSKEETHARSARVVVLGLKPHFAKRDGSSADGNLASDLRLSVMQRSDGDHGGYRLLRNWPSSDVDFGTGSLDLDDENDAYDDSKKGEDDKERHSGPHFAMHPFDRPHHKDEDDKDHGADPRWADADKDGDEDDLVLTLSDLDFDARAVRDDSGHGPDDHYGLASSTRLHGLQYFPDPFLPLLNRKREDAWDARPRNTARAFVEFRLKPSAAGMAFQVVTQLAHHEDFSMPVGDNGPYRLPTNALSANAASSRTWFYGPNTKPPLTDRHQLVGDPRHMPYADLRRANASPNGGDPGHNPSFTASLNTAWGAYGEDAPLYPAVRNNKTTVAMPECVEKGDRNPFLHSNERPSEYEARPEANLLGIGLVKEVKGLDLRIANSSEGKLGSDYNWPAYAAMWREALLSSGAHLVNLHGLPMRYLGQGGEFTLRGQVNASNLGTVSGQAFDQSSAAGVRADELLGGEPLWVVRKDGGWYAKPWIGELHPTLKGKSKFPLHDMWLPQGNLSTTGNEASDRFVRVPIGEVMATDTTWPHAASARRARLDSSLLPYFLGATQNPQVLSSAKLLEAATLNADGLQELTVWGQKAPKAGSLQARAGLLPDGGSNLTLGMPPSAERVGLSWLLQPASKTGWASMAGVTGSATPLGAWRLRGDSAGGDADTPASSAVFAFSTLGAEGTAALPELHRLGLLQAFASHFDGSAKALGEGNVDPLPRVRWLSPHAGQTLPSDQSSLALKWLCRWTRADGRPYHAFLANAFTKPFSATNGDPEPVVFHVKFREVSASGYRFATVAGQGGLAFNRAAGSVPLPSDGLNALPDDQAPGAALSSSWNLGADLAPGRDYLLRLEAFRADANGKATGGAYGYHEVVVRRR